MENLSVRLQQVAMLNQQLQMDNETKSKRLRDLEMENKLLGEENKASRLSMRNLGLEEELGGSLSARNLGEMNKSKEVPQAP